VIREAAIIFAAMLVALAVLDWLAEMPRGWLRYLLTFAVLGAFTATLEVLLPR
jgi:hypothetical protein